MGYTQTLAQIDYRRALAARTLDAFSAVLDPRLPWSELSPSLRVKLMLVAQELLIVSELMDGLDADQGGGEQAVREMERAECTTPPAPVRA